MTSRGDFKLSKIEIIIREENEEEEEQGPQEVPMFDQTMSLLEMIKEKKVISLKLFNAKSLRSNLYILLRRRRGKHSKMKKSVKWLWLKKQKWHRKMKLD